jgi:hypothetical protein
LLELRLRCSNKMIETTKAFNARRRNQSSSETA